MADSAEKDALFWDVLRERDDYRSRCEAAVTRIEREAGKVVDASGAVTSVVLPVDSWRSIRAMLQREPTYVFPPGTTGGDAR